MTEPQPVSVPLFRTPDLPAPGRPVPPARALAGKVLTALFLASLFLVPWVYADDEFRMGLFAKYLALAILALGVDLIWGYTGMLSLGQGLYFGLGAYSMAFSLKLQQAAHDAHKPVGTVAPDFMNYTNLPVTHPQYVPPRALTWIAPLGNVWVALAVAVVLPVVVAVLFGLVTFRLRIRGVYFSIITQALLMAVFTLVLNQQPYTGGVVGIKNLEDLELFGITFNPYNHVKELYFLNAAALVVCFLLCAGLMRTKFGKVLTAIRDNENRVLAMGYPTAAYRTAVFALAGALGGVAGALYVAANALCGPEYLGIAFSIEAVILVAVGGRGTLIGAVLGAFVVNSAKSYVSEAWPRAWPLVLGGLFIGVVLFLPDGLIGLLRRGGDRFGRLFRRKPRAAT